MVTLELTAFEAMQLQSAMGERLIRLNTKPVPSHPLEGAVTLAAQTACDSVIRKVVEALYPDPEPLTFPDWTPGELQEAFGK